MQGFCQEMNQLRLQQHVVSALDRSFPCVSHCESLKGLTPCHQCHRSFPVHPRRHAHPQHWLLIPASER